MHLELEATMWEVVGPIMGLIVIILGGVAVYFAVRPHWRAARETRANDAWSQRLRELEEVLNNILVATQSGTTVSEGIVQALTVYFPGNRMPLSPQNYWSTTDRVMRAEQILRLALDQRQNGLLVLPPVVDQRIDMYVRQYPDSFTSLL